MGRQGRNARTLVSRLEAGAAAHPTLGLIADYLRACRAGFADILDVLDKYTSRKPAEEAKGRGLVSRLVTDLPQRTAKQVSAYDAKTAIARRFEGKEPLEPEERLSRAEKLARAIAGQDRVRERLRGLWSRLEAPATLVNGRAASNYAHQLWAELVITRGRSARVRARRVAGLLAKALKAGLLPEPDIRLIHTEVRELFRSYEQTGKLGPAVMPARPRPRRPRLTEREKLPEPMRRNETATAMATVAVVEQLYAEKVDNQTRMRWLRWLAGLAAVGLHTQPGAPERDAGVAEIAAGAPDPARVPEFAARFFATLDKWRPKT